MSGSSAGENTALGFVRRRLRRIALHKLSQSTHTPRQVALGNGFACTLSSAGEIACWGTNANLQLGQAGGGSRPQQRTNCSYTALEVPVPQAALLAAGRHLQRPGRVARASLLGTAPEPPTDRPLPSGASGEIVKGRGGVLPGPIRGVGAVTQLGMGDNHGCVVGDDTSALKCWGAPGIVWSGQAGQPVADDLQAILLSRTAYLRRLTRRRSSSSPSVESTPVRYERTGRFGAGATCSARGMAVETGRGTNGLWGTPPEFAFSLGCA